MLDFGQNFNQIHPNWFDTMRLTKLPKSEEQFGKDGSTFAGVRQSRLGVRSTTPTALGDLNTTFEFELFGVGVDEGQTTFRLRHAYGELGAFGAGQYWSPFMDIDVFPNSLEYWGPTGMPLFRNVQVRWMPIKGDTRMTIALERPGASGDAGVLADRIELQNVKGRFPAPDLSGEYRMGGSKGYFEVAGILRYMKWDDVLDDQFELSDSAIGWGINLTSNIKFGSDTLHLLGVFGEGIQNYMNDSPVDVGIVRNPGQHRHAGEGRASADYRLPGLLRSQLELGVDLVGRLLRPVQRQHQWSGARRVQERFLRARQPPVLAGTECHDGRGVPVGQARELQRRLHERRHEDPVLVQVQLLRQDRRVEDSDSRPSASGYSCSTDSSGASEGLSK